MEKLRYLEASMTMSNIYLSRTPESEFKVSETRPIQVNIN